jgi:hypothetical protein
MRGLGPCALWSRSNPGAEASLRESAAPSPSAFETTEGRAGRGRGEGLGTTPRRQPQTCDTPKTNQSLDGHQRRVEPGTGTCRTPRPARSTKPKTASRPQPPLVRSWRLVALPTKDSRTGFYRPAATDRVISAGRVGDEAPVALGPSVNLQPSDIPRQPFGDRVGPVSVSPAGKQMRTVRNRPRSAPKSCSQKDHKATGPKYD